MTIKVFGSPTKYVQGPGALAQIGELTASYAQCPMVIVDTDVLPFVKDTLETAFAGRDHAILSFSGEVTHAAMDALVEQTQGMTPDIIIGLGGGKGLDIAKGVSRKLGLKFISVPTIASNDSPTGRAMAIYNDNHELVEMGFIPDSPVLVLADTKIIAGAPANFLRAGMGDAIAKKFEAERAVADGASNFFGGKATITALAIADTCYQTLRKYGVEGIAAADRHEVTEAFEAVVEANVLMSGLGFESSGLSYAHAVVRGLSKAREIKKTPHGYQVAYGTLVQLAIEGRDDAYILDVMNFLREVKLPASLQDLGMDNPQPEEIQAIAEATSVGPKGGLIIVAVSADEIVAAINRVQQLAGV